MLPCLLFCYITHAGAVLQLFEGFKRKWKKGLQENRKKVLSDDRKRRKSARMRRVCIVCILFLLSNLQKRSDVNKCFMSEESTCNEGDLSVPPVPWRSQGEEA